ncbi:MAG: hypothetical protein CUN55_06895 [Phototrophicales bacterium]|nr:MAG: hypothetical protein CUN55_06895 [Phototrophicales bacterium]
MSNKAQVTLLFVLPLLLMLIGAIATNGNMVAMIVLGLVIIFAVGIWIWIWGYDTLTESHQTQLILSDLNELALQLTVGNYAARLPVEGRKPSLKNAYSTLNTALQQIDTIFQKLFPMIDTINERIEVILKATNEQIGISTDQDTSVMQTSSTVQEVRATVTETAERAAAVAEMAQTSVDVSKAGQQAVSDTIEGMNLIRRRVESIADKILVLSEHTQQIGEIIATVSALADQSKLLALNASVEAARAGEEGKGFAVVAMEVRNLAEQSREATNQVREILSEIQQATNSAVLVTEEGTKGVDAGVTLVNRAGESIRELMSTIEEAAYAAVQIAASTRQQTVGMDQLAMAIQNIRQNSSQNTASTMAVERAARELSAITRNLSSLFESLRTTE